MENRDPRRAGSFIVIEPSLIYYITMRLGLRFKLFLLVFLGVFIPMEIIVIYVLHKNQLNMEEDCIRQGRMLFNEILVTRRWLSMHGGVYVYKYPFVKASPFLDNADTATREGDPITLRTPDLVTRELSQLSGQEGMSSFRIVSSKPINPANLPDPWEKESLASFQTGIPEKWEQSGLGLQTRFRYMAPILTEASCLRCHQEYAYQVSDVRGAISLEFPVGEMIIEARRDNLIFGLLAAGLGLAAIFLLWLATRFLFLQPIFKVTSAVAAMGKGNYDVPLARLSNDELGDLADTVIRMRSLVRDYNQELEQEVAVRTQELELMQARALNERDFLINRFQKMTDGVCVTSREKKIVEYMNPSLEALFGKAKDTPCEKIFASHPELREICDYPDLGPEVVIRKETTLPGGSRVFDVLASDILNPDGSRSRIMVFRDITERKRLEEALREINQTLEAKVREQTLALLEQEKLAALGEVSAGLAHEIRNPLSAILSGISLLESGRRSEAEREHIIKLIKREAGRLNSSLTDFLLFARPQKPKKVRIEMNGLIREIVRLIGEDPEIRGQVEIGLELEDLPLMWFDDDQLRQLIWNVALNALQAMGGKGKLIFRTRMEDDNSWRLEIEDTGPGIPPEIQNRVFDPFFSTKKEGTGLGLSIVRRIVNAHGGAIDFECKDAKGCKFIVIVPVAEGDPNPGSNNRV